MKLLRIFLETIAIFCFLYGAAYAMAAIEQYNAAQEKARQDKLKAEIAHRVRWADLDAAARAMVAFDRIGKK